MDVDRSIGGKGFRSGLKCVNKIFLFCETVNLRHRWVANPILIKKIDAIYIFVTAHSRADLTLTIKRHPDYDRFSIDTYITRLSDEKKHGYFLLAALRGKILQKVYRKTPTRTP